MRNEHGVMQCTPNGRKHFVGLLLDSEAAKRMCMSRDVGCHDCMLDMLNGSVDGHLDNIIIFPWNGRGWIESDDSWEILAGGGNDLRREYRVV